MARLSWKTRGDEKVFRDQPTKLRLIVRPARASNVVMKRDSANTPFLRSRQSVHWAPGDRWGHSGCLWRIGERRGSGRDWGRGRCEQPSGCWRKTLIVVVVLVAAGEWSSRTREEEMGFAWMGDERGGRGEGIYAGEGKVKETRFLSERRK